MITAQQVRTSFLQYFENLGHKTLPSSSLVPIGDPSLLLVNSGMAQFKPYFLGLKTPEYRKMATCQRCIRAVGAHNDIENVGYTNRHLVLFEMLGHFLVSDSHVTVSKVEQCLHAIKFLNLIGIKTKYLIFTTHASDIEAYDALLSINIPKEKIARINSSDNFWSMGGPGPCGYCAEIYYVPEKHINKNATEIIEQELSIEIWNLVFMSMKIDENEKISNLPNAHLDAGMGLERLCAVLQGVESNFDTDELKHLIEVCAQVINHDKWKNDKEFTIASRIIADHTRAFMCLIADGVIPGNTGRQYVLRKLLRRTMATIFRVNDGKISQHIVKSLIDSVAPAIVNTYPRISEHHKNIVQIVSSEVEIFSEALHKGMHELSKIISKSSNSIIDGASLFKLYDSRGFPLEIIKDIARESKIELDLDGFHDLLEQQKARARTSSKFTQTSAACESSIDSLSSLPDTKFIGYTAMQCNANLLYVKIRSDKSLELVFNQTPIYALGGGQDPDIGLIEFNGKKIAKIFSAANVDNKIVHFCEFREEFSKSIGEKHIGSTFKIKVHRKTRQALAANHSTAHILNFVLIKKFGSCIKNAGSNISSQKARFDFTINQNITHDDIESIENSMNDIIFSKQKVSFYEKKIDDAKSLGAKMMPNEEYSDIVRIVDVGKSSAPISRELCCGTHVKNTGDIGSFSILKVESIASGIKRIEFVTGLHSAKLAIKKSSILRNLSLLFSASLENLPIKISEIQSQNISLNKTLKTLSGAIASLIFDTSSACHQIYKDQLFFISSKLFENYKEHVLPHIYSMGMAKKDGITVVADGKKIIVISGASVPQSLLAKVDGALSEICDEHKVANGRFMTKMTLREGKNHEDVLLTIKSIS